MKCKTKLKIFLFTFLLLFLLLAFVLCYLLEKNFNIAATQYCDQTVVSKMSEILNASMIKTIENENCKNIITTTTDDNGNIKQINVDTNKLNVLKSKMTLSVISDLENYEMIKFGIPFGNALGSYALSGIGPKIPVRAVPVGSAVSKIKSSFVSAGINQTKYELYIEFIVCINIISPFSLHTREIKGELCVAETIIVGETPGVIWGSNN